MQHTIGTATATFNTSTAAEASSQAAHVSAYEQANSSKYGMSGQRLQRNL